MHLQIILLLNIAFNFEDSLVLKKKVNIVIYIAIMGIILLLNLFSGFKNLSLKNNIDRTIY